MHQSVVSNKGNALELWFRSVLQAKRSWIHDWTIIWFCMSALVLMSTPSQTAFVKWHWRKRWLIVSVSVWHNGHTGSQLIPLRHSSVLRGRAVHRSFQVNVSILWGMGIFQRCFHIWWGTLLGREILAWRSSYAFFTLYSPVVEWGHIILSGIDWGAFLGVEC